MRVAVRTRHLKPAPVVPRAMHWGHAQPRREGYNLWPASTPRSIVWLVSHTWGWREGCAQTAHWELWRLVFLERWTWVQFMDDGWCRNVGLGRLLKKERVEGVLLSIFAPWKPLEKDYGTPFQARECHTIRREDASSYLPMVTLRWLSVVAPNFTVDRPQRLFSFTWAFHREL